MRWPGRIMLRTMLVAAGVLAACAARAAETATHAEAVGSADTVLAALKAGNQRHVNARYTHPHQTTSRRL